MAKKQKKLGWDDSEDLVFRLIDTHPDLDPRRLSPEEIISHVKALPDFSDKAKPSAETLQELSTSWYEERVDMDDELGPLREVPEEGVLDEDEYREDREAVDSYEEEEEDSETLSIEELEEDDEEEDEL